MNSLIRFASLAACGGLWLPGSASAQDRASFALLQNAMRVDCQFSQLAKGEWDTAEPRFVTEAVGFSAVFYDIDVEGGTAEAEGRFGDSFIIVRYAEGYLHFMQAQNSGPLYLTTVMAQAAGEGRLKAVHTRHEYTPISLPGFTSRPEMYLGDCAVERAAEQAGE